MHAGTETNDMNIIIISQGHDVDKIDNNNNDILFLRVSVCIIRNYNCITGNTHTD